MGRKDHVPRLETDLGVWGKKMMTESWDLTWGREESAQGSLRNTMYEFGFSWRWALSQALQDKSFIWKMLSDNNSRGVGKQGGNRSLEVELDREHDVRALLEKGLKRSQR